MHRSVWSERLNGRTSTNVQHWISDIASDGQWSQRPRVCSRMQASRGCSERRLGSQIYAVQEPAAGATAPEATLLEMERSRRVRGEKNVRMDSRALCTV